MATERRPVAPNLEDASDSNNGAALSLKNEGDAHDSDGVNYQGALVAKKASDGTLIFPVTNDAGELIVDTDGTEKACNHAQGTLDDGAASFTTVTEITLTNSNVYSEIQLHISCFRDTIWKIEQVDDEGGGGETITQLVKGRLTSQAESNYCCKWDCLEITAGATGTVKLRVQAYNPNSVSDIDAMLSCKEDTTP